MASAERVVTSEPWTRDGIKGLLYFRDPSGNLFEMYCPMLKEAAHFVRGAKQGGNYTIDLSSLNYDGKAKSHQALSDKGEQRRVGIIKQRMHDTNLGYFE